MTKIRRLNLVIVMCFLFMVSGKPSDTTLEKPNIVAGTAQVTGRIIKPKNANKDKIFVTVIVQHPISGENLQYKIPTDSLGKFAINVEVETDMALIGLNVNLNTSKLLFAKLENNGQTNIDITYNSDNEIENIKVTPSMKQNDVIRGFELMDKMIKYRPKRQLQTLYDKNADYFLNHVNTAMSEKLMLLKNDTLISKELKEVLSNDLRLWMYKSQAFNYEELMMLNYKNTNKNNDKNPIIKKPEIQYYSFLKNLNFKDMQYLNSYTFTDFQKEILQNETIGLPEIGDSDIATWLKNVKYILAELIGFENGKYYDILAANAYGRQLNQELRPLSKRQKQNIQNYWKNGEIAKILLRKNQKVVELDKLKTPTIINDVSSILTDKVIDTILAKHKNKVVFIDLWATWCIPCLEAMETFRSTKSEFKDKNIAFVYITNGTSPRNLWEEKIKGIGSEHYYLKDTQWEFIMNKYGFNAIPSYLLYDKNGLLIKKFTAFPENNIVKEMINDLL